MRANGRRFRVPVMVDDFSRECLTLVVETSLSRMQVARELAAIAVARGRPRNVFPTTAQCKTPRNQLLLRRRSRVVSYRSHWLLLKPAETYRRPNELPTFWKDTLASSTKCWPSAFPKASCV